MFKKITILSFTMFVFAFIQSNKCFAEATLEQAQMNIFMLMEAGDFNSAMTATDKFIADFSNNKDLPEAVYWIIRKCEWKSEFDKAKILYQKMMQNYSSSPCGTKAQIGIARCEAMAFVISQDYASAKTAINKITSDFAGNPELTESLLMIAERFEWQSKFEEEKGIFQLLIKDIPSGEFAKKAKIGIARADILSFAVMRDYAKVDGGIDMLFSDFADNSELAQTAIIIGEWFYKDKTGEPNDNLNRAIKVWERVIKELPNSELIPEAYYWEGESYQKLGDFIESIQKYQTVANNYPSFKYAWYALFKVGRNYESMKKSGLISDSEADYEIKNVYTQFIEKYPTSRYAEYVNTWLKQNNK